MKATEQSNTKTRLIEVTMKFYKVFHVEVPEGVTEHDVLNCDLVEEEERSFGGNVTLEHDQTITADNGHKTPKEIESLRRHEKVFSWNEANG